MFERAGQAVMAKIMENEKAAAALPQTGPGRVAIPTSQRAGPAEGRAKRKARWFVEGTKVPSASLRSKARSNPSIPAQSDGLLASLAMTGLAIVPVPP